MTTSGEKLKSALSPVKKSIDHPTQEDGELLSSDDYFSNQQRPQSEESPSLKKLQIPYFEEAPPSTTNANTVASIDDTGRKKPSRWGKPIDFANRRNENDCKHSKLIVNTE